MQLRSEKCSWNRRKPISRLKSTAGTAVESYEHAIVVPIAKEKRETSQSARPTLDCLLQDTAYRFWPAKTKVQITSVKVLHNETILWILLIGVLVIVMAQPFELILYS